MTKPSERLLTGLNSCPAQSTASDKENRAPEEIWAFYAPEIAEDEGGATIVAHETTQHGSQRYVRGDLFDEIRQELDGVIKMIGEA